MIEEITLTKRVQTPTPPNEWCYQDQGENFRYFTKRVLLGKDAEPWPECTDEEKVQWEEEHKEVTLIADEGCWLTRVGFTPEQESAPEFWKEVRTSEPEDYTEVTDTLRTEMEDQWRAAHPEPEPSPEPEQASPADEEGEESAES